jgi:hypothetical protein
VDRYRVKSLTGWRNAPDRAVNLVWHVCNDRQKDAVRCHRPWPTGGDQHWLTCGARCALGSHSGTFNAVGAQYAKSRSQKKRPFLRHRSRQKSLAWVPFKGRDLQREGDALRFADHTFRVFHSRALPEGKIKDGSNCARDRKGNGFLTSVIEVDAVAPGARPPLRGVGIDLGLKALATFSTGEKIAAQRSYRGAEQALAIAQRARKQRCVHALHAPIGHRRNNFHHQHSARLVRADQHHHGAVGTRCRLLVLARHAPISVDEDARLVRGSARTIHLPTLVGGRHPARCAPDRERRPWHQQLGLIGMGW